MEYKATYRRTQTALPGLLLVLLGLALAVTYKVMNAGGGGEELTFILWTLGLSLGAIAFIFANTFRIHRWTIAGEELEIAERPKVPLTGLPRRASVAYAEIAGFHRVESGVDYLIEISTNDGRTFRLPQAMKADPKGFGTPDPDANLDVFADAIYSAARAAGSPLPDPSEGLSFWNTVPGLLFLSLILLIASAFAVLAAWAVLDGGLPTHNRATYGAAIAILLPFGAGWLLRKSWRRRRQVLAGRRAG